MSDKSELLNIEIPTQSGVDEFLTDESRLRGRAERVFLPRSESDLVSILRSASDSGTPVTLSCGRTGIAGGAVPMGGWLVSCERMSRIAGLGFDEELKEFRLRCGPGVSLETIQGALDGKEFADAGSWPESDRAALALLKKEGYSYVFPPDPTERSAGLGGMVACNASGARTLHYGPTRDYVSRLRMVLADGSVIDLRRGECRASLNGAFEVKTAGGETRSGTAPVYPMPRVKNAAGYYSAPEMDVLDLFIGSEGTLAAFSEIEIRLVRAPEATLGVLAFFPSEENAVCFVRAALGERGGAGNTSPLKGRPMALEFFDSQSLRLLEKEKQAQGAGSTIPALPEEAHTAVYIELETRSGTDPDIENAAESLLMLLESCRSRAETAWTALTGKENERLKTFRHALPEAVNRRIAARAVEHEGLTKLGADFAVPDERLEDMLAAYHSALDKAGLEYAIFGHIGNSHLHLNILPRDMAEYETGKDVYMELARQITRWGGTISGEHGVGKLKKHLLRLMYGDSAIAEMRAAKRALDPCFLLNPGNIFD